MNPSLNVTGTPKIINQTSTSLVVGGLTSTQTIHAIAIRNPRHLFLNLFQAPSNAIRNRRMLQSSN